MILFQFRMNGRVQIKKNNNEPKKNRKTGKMFLGPRQKYKNWEALLVILLRQEMRKWPVKFPIECGLNLELRLYFANRAHIPDLSNCYEGIQDALQKSGCIINDKQINGHDRSRRIFGAESEFFEIILTELPEVLYGDTRPDND